MVFQSPPPKQHEDCMIVVVQPALQVDQIEQVVLDIRAFIQHEHGMNVVSCSLHPLGVGIFQLSFAIQREILVFGNPH